MNIYENLRTYDTTNKHIEPLFTQYICIFDLMFCLRKMI